MAAEVLARAEKVAQASWETAVKEVPSQRDALETVRDSFVSAVRIAYLTGMNAAEDMIGTAVQAQLKARGLDGISDGQLTALMRRRARGWKG